MREKDIRERIHIFLRDTVRHVVVPASMGIGLALVGCGDTSLNASQDGSADTSFRPGWLWWGRDCCVHGHGGYDGLGRGDRSGRNDRGRRSDGRRRSDRGRRKRRAQAE